MILSIDIWQFNLRHSGLSLGDFVKKITMTIKMQPILRLQQALLCSLIRLGTRVSPMLVCISFNSLLPRIDIEIDKYLAQNFIVINF